MKKPKLDLSKPNCHVCGNPLKRDIKNQIERCVHFACQIRDIDFNIPYIMEKKS